jgi:TolB-like protein/Tfp pilus assembly protein PilF
MSTVVRFGPFEFNSRTGELTKAGRRLALSPQPARLLSLLISRAGDLVTRDEIRRHLWPDGVFLEFDLALNACLANLRVLLGDRARAPRYVETLPRRGYRFIAPIERVRDFAQPTIAVLPFATLGGDGSREYVADGMTDALITELASISSLRVISRQSVLHLKGSDKPLDVIARELGVDAVVEGTALHSDAVIRITAQLVAVAPERHIWARAYDCAPADVISVQREVARAVAEGVDAALTPVELSRLSHPLRLHPDAQEAYARGLFHAADWSRDGLTKALRCFERAVAIDADYAPTHAALAYLFNSLAFWGHMPLDEGFTRAKQEAQAALLLDERSAAAHAQLGFNHWWYDWDPQACDRQRRLALELGPSDVGALVLSSLFRITACGDPAGVADAELALRLDPLSQSTNFTLAWIYWFAGDVVKARQQALATLELFPASAQAGYALGLSELQVGHVPQAIAALEKAAATAPDSLSLGYLGLAYGAAGRADEARRLLAEVLARREREFVSLKPLIVLHMGLRENARALDFLEEALRVRDPILLMVQNAPPFVALRQEPRYRAIVDRLPVPALRVAATATPARPQSAGRRS